MHANCTMAAHDQPDTTTDVKTSSPAIASPIPAAIVNTPLWRAMGADRKDAADLQNALVNRFSKCSSWREIITEATEDACDSGDDLAIPAGIDPKVKGILMFDAAAVAGFCLALTAPKTVDEVDLWPDRAHALMDVENWRYRGFCLAPSQPRPGIVARLTWWLRRQLRKGGN